MGCCLQKTKIRRQQEGNEETQQKDNLNDASTEKIAIDNDEKVLGKRKIILRHTNEVITPYKIPKNIIITNDQIDQEIIQKAKAESIQQQEPTSYRKVQQTPINDEILAAQKSEIIMEGNEDEYFGPDEAQYANKLYSLCRIKDNHFEWVPSEKIGQGSFGKVIMGMMKSNGKMIAVKQVELSGPNKQIDSEKIKSLEIEIDLLSRLKHRNIVSYYGSEITSTHMNIFLEYVASGSLYSLLRKFGKFKESLLKVYLREILAGLIYLHDNGVVHRDIKSANILVDNNGVCKLADFGSSKMLSEITGMDQIRSIQGTPNYMAPEVVNQQKSGRKSDIWSLGCTVIELITGKPPWNDLNNAITIMIKIAKTQQPPPLPENLSYEAQDFLLNCLQVNPNQRWTARKLLNHPFLQQSHLKPASSPKKKFSARLKSPQQSAKVSQSKETEIKAQITKEDKSPFRTSIANYEQITLGVAPTNSNQGQRMNNFTFDLSEDTIEIQKSQAEETSVIKQDNQFIQNLKINIESKNANEHSFDQIHSFVESEKISPNKYQINILPEQSELESFKIQTGIKHYELNVFRDFLLEDVNSYTSNLRVQEEELGMSAEILDSNLQNIQEKVELSSPETIPVIKGLLTKQSKQSPKSDDVDEDSSFEQEPSIQRAQTLREFKISKEAQQTPLFSVKNHSDLYQNSNDTKKLSKKNIYDLRLNSLQANVEYS